MLGFLSALASFIFWNNYETPCNVKNLQCYFIYTFKIKQFIYILRNCLGSTKWRNCNLSSKNVLRVGEDRAEQNWGNPVLNNTNCSKSSNLMTILFAVWNILTLSSHCIRVIHFPTSNYLPYDLFIFLFPSNSANQTTGNLVNNIPTMFTLVIHL